MTRRWRNGAAIVVIIGMLIQGGSSTHVVRHARGGGDFENAVSVYMVEREFQKALVLTKDLAESVDVQAQELSSHYWEMYVVPFLKD